MAKPTALEALPAGPAGRLLGGLALAIEEKGYAATTIADIVRHARVSKRTFYEHFADKESCYLALYEAVSDGMLRVIAGAVTVDLPWRARVDAAARAYLAELAAQPALTRAFLFEIQAAGPRALQARRAVMGRFAELLRTLTADAARGDASVAPLSESMAVAVVGGINELILLSVERGETERLPQLAGVATELILAVVTAPVAVA